MGHNDDLEGCKKRRGELLSLLRHSASRAGLCCSVMQRASHAVDIGAERERKRETRGAELLGNAAALFLSRKTDNMQPRTLLSSVFACQISSRLLAGPPVSALCSPHGRSPTSKREAPVPCSAAGPHTHACTPSSALSCKQARTPPSSPISTEVRGCTDCRAAGHDATTAMRQQFIDHHAHLSSAPYRPQALFLSYPLSSCSRSVGMAGAPSPSFVTRRTSAEGGPGSFSSPKLASSLRSTLTATSAARGTTSSAAAGMAAEEAGGESGRGGTCAAATVASSVRASLMAGRLEMLSTLDTLFSLGDRSFLAAAAALRGI